MNLSRDRTTGSIHIPQAPVLDARRVLVLAICLNLAFVAVEAVSGFLSGSLALLTDAGHNLSDVAGLALALLATALTRRPATRRRTYGWSKASILAALFNSMLIVAAVALIAGEAVRRLRHPAPVVGSTMIVVATIGIFINGATALLFRRYGKKDLNLRGAFLHMSTDAWISASVVLGGALIATTGRFWIDPLVSLAAALCIPIGTWRLLKDSIDLAMDAVPPGIQPERILEYLNGLPGVVGVCDLHIWALSTTETALTVHLVKPESVCDDTLMRQARDGLKERFGIGHITLQWERPDYTCEAERALADMRPEPDFFRETAREEPAWMAPAVLQ